MWSLFAASLLAVPPLVNVADADAMAWVHVPRAGESLAALERSAFQQHLPLLMPDTERKALAGKSEIELLTTVYRRKPSPHHDVVVMMDVGKAQETIADMMRLWLGQLGYPPGKEEKQGDLRLERLGGGPRAMTLFAGQGRCGWTTDPARAQRVLEEAAEPLGESDAFERFVARTPEADLRARVDVQRFYGFLARKPSGPRLAGLIRRLGLDRVRALEVQSRLESKSTLRAEARIWMPQPYNDLPAALGPAIAHQEPPVPAGVGSYVRMSVRPKRLWYVAEKLLIYERPIEATLARAQLDAIQAQAKKSLTEDALGDEPRAWTFYQTELDGWAAWVLVAEVADAKLAARIIGDYAKVLPTISPRIRVSTSKVGKAEVVKIGGLRFGFTDRELIVASSQAALTEQLKLKRRKGRSLGATPVIAFGTGQLGRPRPQNRALGALVEQLGKSAWTLRAIEDGFVIDAVVR